MLNHIQVNIHNIVVQLKAQERFSHGNIYTYPLMIDQRYLKDKSLHH
jgi:uncharacterized Tic20 family protein